MQRNIYSKFISELRNTIQKSRYQAAKLVNKEILLLYSQVGKRLSEKINAEKWGAKVLQNISDDLQKEMPGLKGFSGRNLYKMVQFYDTYKFFEFMPSSTAKIKKQPEFMPSSTAKLKISVNNFKSFETPFGKTTTAQVNILTSQEFINVFLSISFTHHVLLLNKIRNWDELFFYMQKSVENQWSVSLLQHHIETDLFSHKGKIKSNFKQVLPEKIYPHALQAFKDEYLLDFINIREEDVKDERIFENKIVENIKNFILSIGKEFAFMGNQYRLVVEGDEFFVDLLFYHRELQSLIAFELKTGKFKPEYAGKMNFYLNALDEYVKLPHENPSIGVILCREKNNTVVEFAFKTIDKPMGVGIYKLSKKLPEKYRKYIPDSKTLEKIL